MYGCYRQVQVPVGGGYLAFASDHRIADDVMCTAVRIRSTLPYRRVDGTGDTLQDRYPVSSVN